MHFSLSSKIGPWFSPVLHSITHLSFCFYWNRFSLQASVQPLSILDHISDFGFMLEETSCQHVECNLPTCLWYDISWKAVPSLTHGSQTLVLEKVGSCHMVKLYNHFNDGEPESFFILEFVRLEVELIFKFHFLIFRGAYHL